MAVSGGYVFDSFALLAYFGGEAGMPRVRSILAGAENRRHSVHISLINLGEVLYITERERGLAAARRTLSVFDALPIEVLPVSRATVLTAAHIKAHYRISYADAFAVAAARDVDGTVVTGDPELRAIADAGLIAVDWLPQARP